MAKHKSATALISVVATQASSILMRKNKTKTLCPVTVLVDSQESDRCPWATCFIHYVYYIKRLIIIFKDWYVQTQTLTNRSEIIRLDGSREIVLSVC